MKNPARSPKAYPSDVSDEEWSFVVPYLTLIRLDSEQREHDLRAVFNALRWLVRSDDHWNFMQPLGPGLVTPDGDKAQFGSQAYKIFQNANAEVTYITGEFYWKVSVGEIVQLQPVPAMAVAVKLAGKVSVSNTPPAWDGPLFTTVSV